MECIIVSVQIFGMGVYETFLYRKIYFEAYVVFFICCISYSFSFSFIFCGSITENGSDVHRFSNRKWVLAVCTV